VFRFSIWKPALLVCCVGQPCVACAGEPARLPLATASPNQQMADHIARTLTESGRLHHYTIDVTFENGVTELTGSVADQGQREEALRIVQGIPGVVQVRDRLTLSDAIKPVQAADQPPRLPPPLPGPANPPLPGASVPEPAPIFQGPPPSGYDMNPPKMPPYAWPTYAPYNNYSRVAYPQAYPYQAWPFIGPIYPFPKIPPGWRSVTLEWQDGHWWFSNHATKHDLWRMRFW